MPAESVLIVKVAVPPERAEVPNNVAPSRNSMVPVVDGIIVAVNVTGSSSHPGLGFDVNVTVCPETAVAAINQYKAVKNKILIFFMLFII